MLNIISGYCITETLYQSKKTTILRATKLDNQQSVVIKLPLAADPKQIEKLQHEFTLCQLINSEYVVKHLELKADSTHGVLLIEEDNQAKSLLSQIPPNGYELLDFLHIAIQLAQGLGTIHQHGIIHKDIKPANLIISNTGKVKYIDFGSASTWRQITSITVNTLTSENTLAYISPEQTNRMSRPVDCRTDFYSLGITLYQLACGRLPFIENDPLKLIHCHLAQQPVTLYQIKPTILKPVSDIIMKLLQKDADERYQSAHGILNDLTFCLKNLSEDYHIPEFSLGEQDVPIRFSVRLKLYGRDKELLFLENMINQVRQGGSKQCLISGAAGTGKSILVRELKNRVDLTKYWVLEGKFEQLNRTTAYSGFIQAFKQWVQQLLICGEKIILEWKVKLQKALGNNGKLITNLLPELEWIIGTQSAIATLDAVQSKNQFYLILQNFISTLAQPEHPLILFFDDLQWADPASLLLLENLVVDAKTPYVCLIGAYRDNEIESSHPLSTFIENICKTGTAVQTLELSSLSPETMNHWIADTLQMTSELTVSLAELIYAKTNGNPFFIKAFLQTIYDEQLLIRDEQGNWQWDLEKIQRHSATENVIQLMIHQLKQLPLLTQQSLQWASCIGHRFTLEILQKIIGKTHEQLMVELQPSTLSGLLMQDDAFFKFSHDRIQEAAYNLIPLESIPVFHLTLGRLLHNNLPAEAGHEQLFEVVEHFNQALPLIEDQNERLMLAKLNLQASNKAKHSIAYEAALNYLYVARNCLNFAKGWLEYYALTYSLHKELAELEYLTGHFERSQEMLNLLLMNAQSNVEKADIYHLLIIQKTLTNQPKEAVAVGRTALRLLGLELPENQEQLEQIKQQASMKIQEYFKDKEIATLLQLPLMQDPEKKIAIKLFARLVVPAHMTAPALMHILVVLMNQFSIQYGQSAESGLGYCFYATLLCAQEDYKRGYQFGELAIQQSQRFNDNALRCRIMSTFTSNIRHWKQPLKLGTLYEEGIKAAIEAGELQYVGYFNQYQAIRLLHQGESLSMVLSELDSLLKSAIQTKNQLARSSLCSSRLIVLNLLGRTEKDTHFADELQDETLYLAEWQRQKYTYTLLHHYIFKAQVYYLHNYAKEALDCILQAKEQRKLLLEHTSMSITVLNFYHSLILLALYSEANSKTQSAYWQQLEINQRQMQIWAENCAENFLHKYLIVAAEMQRLQNAIPSALKLYDQAILAAQKSGFTQEMALIYELTAKFWLTQGMQSHAQGFLVNAYHHYVKWGAKRKAEIFKNQHQHLLQAAFATTPLSNFSISSGSSINADTLVLLDLASVLKASQSISSDLELTNLLSNMMKIVIENAGAQKGMLFLQEESGEWLLQAEYSDKRINTLQQLPYSQWQEGSHAIIDYVKTTQQVVLLSNASTDPQFRQDTYVTSHQVKSLLCMPITKQKKIKAILYLENNLSSHVFTNQHLLTLTLLASQMCISLENNQYFQARTEEERRRRDEAERNHKEMEDFIDMICHGIRNPLNGIYGNVNFLQDILAKFKTLSSDLDKEKNQPFLKLLEQYEENLHSIGQCIEHQKRIVDKTLHLSKLQSGNVILQHKPFQLKALLEETLRMYSTSITTKHLQLIPLLPEQEVVIKGDPDYLKVILENLITNAIKFTKEGAITIGVQLTDTTTTHTKVLLSVTDTGVGMTPEEQSHLFKRFSQPVKLVSPSYTGSGLGLAITEQLVKLMKGEIQVESEKGRGTRFTICLSCEFANADEKKVLFTHKAATPFFTLTLSPKHILVVEDNFLNQKIICKQLQQARHTYEVANHGKEAIAKYNSESTFDLIFMDLLMPEMGGLEATQKIREIEKQAGKKPVPIIGLSANAREIHREAALSAGMNDYIIKPYNKELLLQKIAEYTQTKVISSTKTRSSRSASPAFFGSALVPSSSNPQLITTSTQVFSLSKKRKLETTEKSSDVTKQTLISRLKYLENLLADYQTSAAADSDYIIAIRKAIEKLNEHPDPLNCVESHIKQLEEIKARGLFLQRSVKPWQ